MAFVSVPWILFLWNLWKWTGRVGPSSSRTKITLFLLANLPQPLLLSHMLAWWHPEGTSWLLFVPYDSPFLRQSGLYSGMCPGTRKMDVSPRSPSLGNIPGNYSGKSNQGLGGMELNQSRIPSGVPLMHLHSASTVELGGMNKVPVSVRDRLSPTREGKLRWRVCLHLHLEQGRMLLVQRSHGCECHFILLQTEASRSRTTPLKCIKKKKKKSWDKFDPQSLKKICLIFFCDIEWPQYPLEDEEHWTITEGSQL